MSRRDQWKQARTQMVSHTSKKRGTEGREAIPDKSCGKCVNFSERAYVSDGTGFCRILKAGSDLENNSPVFITEGEAALMVVFNTDASKCIHFVEMDFIDTDGTECADPVYRRAQRQMEKAMKK